MNEDSGWVKLHRKLKNWGWRSDPNTFLVFINLLLEANFTENNWRGEKLAPGQLIFGRKSFSKKTGISERSIRTALTHLISTNEVTIKTTSKYSVITINNWNQYQQYDQRSDQQPTSNRPATDHTIRNKEIKNIYTSNEEKIFNFINNKIDNEKQGLVEDNPNLVELAGKYDIRSKDVIWCIRDMLSKESDKGKEIVDVESRINMWINNSIRWHKVATLKGKEIKASSKKQDDEDLKGLIIFETESDPDYVASLPDYEKGINLPN
jgi:hypothetical protein